MKRLVVFLCTILIILNTGKFSLNLTEESFASSNSLITFSPFVMGEKASMMLNFVLNKDLRVYEWINFKFSWDDAFPFLHDNKTLKEIVFIKDAYLAFDQYHGKSQVMIAFPSTSELRISKAFILLANQTHTFTLWKEFGLTLPNKPGNYSIQIKTQSEPEWREAVKFVMTEENQYGSSQIQVHYDDTNYRALSSFSLNLPRALFNETKSEHHTIILSLPDDTIYRCWQIGGPECNTKKLWLTQNEAITFDQNQVSSFMLFDKTINCVVEVNNINNDRYVLKVLPTSNMINPSPGNYFMSISIDGKWYKTQIFSISNTYIPLYILKHTQDDVNFLIYYHLPSWENALEYQTITMLLPEEWTINLNSKEKSQFDYMNYHHTEKNTRSYIVFHKRFENLHLINPGDTKELVFFGSNFIHPIQKNYLLNIVFRFDQICPYMKTQELIVNTI